jgi:hypothetical protein
VRGARVLAAVAVAALAAVAFSAPAGATTECRGIKDCLDVVGPWVVVPAHTQADYLLPCPHLRGVVGGLDSLATTQDVRVSFDGLLGGPVGPGTTTTRYAFFRAVTASGRAGAFQPRLGCIPVSSGGRVTTSAFVGPTGGALDYIAVLVPARPGTVISKSVTCNKGEQLVDSWNTTAFDATRPPDLGLATAIRAQRTAHHDSGSASVTVTTSETLPAGSHGEVQLGVICAS